MICHKKIAWAVKPQIAKHLRLCVLMMTCAVLFVAQALADGYQMPPAGIADLVDAPSTPSVYLSSDGEWLLLASRPGLPPLEEVAQPELRLGGRRINPRTNGPSRGYYSDGLSIVNISDGSSREVTSLPENVRISSIGWSPDSKYISLVITTADRLELWATTVEHAEAYRVIPTALNGAYGRA